MAVLGLRVDFEDDEGRKLVTGESELDFHVQAGILEQMGLGRRNAPNDLVSQRVFL